MIINCRKAQKPSACQPADDTISSIHWMHRQGACMPHSGCQMIPSLCWVAVASSPKPPPKLLWATNGLGLHVHEVACGMGSQGVWHGQHTSTNPAKAGQHYIGVPIAACKLFAFMMKHAK